MAEGAEVVTSGQDRLYPKGLPLGRVTLVSPGESFLEVRVQPAAPLGRLEHVLVLAGPPESLTPTAQAAEAPPSSPR
jgi:rod shape-determining protein MreC